MNNEGDTSPQSIGEPRGELRDEPGEGSGWTTTKQAAKVLGVSRRTVQEKVRRGELEAIVEGKGVEKTFYVSIDSLNALRERRRTTQSSPRFADVASDTSAEAPRTANAGEADLLAVVQDLQYRLGRAEARAELTERAESTLREQLEAERQQRLEDVQRERAERLTAEERTERLRQEAEETQRRAELLEANRVEAQEEVQRLREELEAERSRGFWRRLFGR